MSVAIHAGYSGAGAHGSARHVAELLRKSEVTPTVLLICGFGGSLGDSEIGDVVIANRVIDCTGQDDTERAQKAYYADSRLLATAESIRLPGIACKSGTLATMDRVLLNRAEKQAFLDRQKLQAQAVCVDMETAGAVRVAVEHGIPWLAIRTITDRFDDAMPLDFNALADRAGNVAIGRVIAATLTHPGKIPALLQLGKRSSRAAHNLTGFLSALLPTVRTL